MVAVSYKIDPAGYCEEDGCRRPALNGGRCAWCEAQIQGLAGTTAGGGEARADAALAGDPEARLPRCIAYLSRAGDVITLELTGEPRFTEADVRIVATVLSRRRR